MIKNENEKKINKKNILDIIKENYVIMKADDFFNIDNLSLIFEFFYIRVKEVEKNGKIDYLIALIKREKYRDNFRNSYFYC